MNLFDVIEALDQPSGESVIDPEEVRLLEQLLRRQLAVSGATLVSTLVH
jgi:hypothetical protein